MRERTFAAMIGTILSSYDQAFASEARAESYVGAMADYPEAMRCEFEALASFVRAGSPPGLVVQPQAAGCALPTFLPDLPWADRVRAFESNAHFVAACARYQQGRVEQAPPDALPLPDACADAVLFSAVLHHADAAERRRIYAEALRVLRPGGRIVVADVIAGSPQDAWLNGFVDAHNPLGHRGMFFTEADAAGLAEAGFVRVAAERRAYPWRFAGPAQRRDFLRRLFYTPGVSDAEMETALPACFPGLDADPASPASLPWELLFLVGEKAA
jgi:SAM-dependent methyltransferase